MYSHRLPNRTTRFSKRTTKQHQTMQRRRMANSGNGLHRPPAIRWKRKMLSWRIYCSMCVPISNERWNEPHHAAGERQLITVNQSRALVTSFVRFFDRFEYWIDHIISCSIFSSVYALFIRYVCRIRHTVCRCKRFGVCLTNSKLC